MNTLKNYILETVYNKSIEKTVNEAFNERDSFKVMTLIQKYLSKKVGPIYMLPKVESFKMKNDAYLAMRFVCGDRRSFKFNWKVKGKSFAPHSVDFFTKDQYILEYPQKPTRSFTYDGLSTAVILPQLVTILSKTDFNVKVSDLRANMLKQISESVGADISLEESELVNIHKTAVFEKLSEEEKRQKEIEKIERLQDIVSKKMAKIQEMQLGIGMEQTPNPFGDDEDLQKKFEDAKKSGEVDGEVYSDPKTAFEQMFKYVELVLNDLQNGLVVAGAPGIGKTFRIMQQIKDLGLKRNIDYGTVKGRVSANGLYRKLYQFKDGGLLIFDDADDLMKDQVSVDLLKGALDTTEPRTVSWETGGVIKGVPTIDDDGNPVVDMEQELPKQFDFEGRIIIITNMRAGQIDTAIRSRVFLQDLNFMAQDIFVIIEKIMPYISPDKLSKDSKTKGLQILKEIHEEGLQFELSIRSFETCAKLVQSGFPDYKSMIKEQMRLQAAKGGKRY